MRTASAGTRLDPVGRRRLPRRGRMLRLTAAALLLLTAAGVLYTGDHRPAGHQPSPTGAATAVPTSGTPADGGTPGTGAPAAVTGPDDASGTRHPVPDGRVGVPVRLADPAGLALLRPGDRVDLLTAVDPATPGDPTHQHSPPPGTVATDVPVLAVDHTAGAVLLALTPRQGRTVAADAAGGTGFAVVLRG